MSALSIADEYLPIDAMSILTSANPSDIQELCAAGSIPGAAKIAGKWLIPMQERDLISTSASARECLPPCEPTKAHVWTADDVADALHCQPRTILRRVRQQFIPHALLPDGVPVFNPEDVLAFQHSSPNRIRGQAPAPTASEPTASELHGAPEVSVVVTEKWRIPDLYVERAILNSHGIGSEMEDIAVLYTLSGRFTVCLLVYNEAIYTGAARKHWKDDGKYIEDLEWTDGYRHAFGRAVAWLSKDLLKQSLEER